MRSYLTAIVLFFCCLPSLRSQNIEDPFLDAFRSVSFDRQCIYFDGWQPTYDDWRPYRLSMNEITPLKGEIINSISIQGKIKRFIDEKHKSNKVFFELPFSGYSHAENFHYHYAIFKYEISTNLYLLVVGYVDFPTIYNQTYGLVYNSSTKEIEQYLLLAFDIDEEGLSVGTQSYIVDINEDGKKDIITREVNIRTNGVSEIVNIQMFSGDTLSSGGYKSNIIRDSVKIGVVAEEFPFKSRKIPHYRSYEKIRDLTDEWLVIMSSDKDYSEAEYELNRAKKLFKSSRMCFQLFSKNKRYYTVSCNYSSLEAAQKALVKLKKDFNNTAYIVKKNDWCPEC